MRARSDPSGAPSARWYPASSRYSFPPHFQPGVVANGCRDARIGGAFILPLTQATLIAFGGRRASLSASNPLRFLLPRLATCRSRLHRAALHPGRAGRVPPQVGLVLSWSDYRRPRPLPAVCLPLRPATLLAVRRVPPIGRHDSRPPLRGRLLRGGWFAGAVLLLFSAHL